MFDIAVMGTATEDVFVSVPASKLVQISDADADYSYLALEYGAKLTVESIFISVGGGSTNTAAGLAAMGLRTVAVAKVGQDDAGDRVLARLTELGIDTSHFVRCTDNLTGLSVILTGFSGDRTILTYRGASAELRESEVPWDVLEQAPWMYVGSMSGESAPLFLRLAQFAGEHGIQLALNPGGTQLQKGWEYLRPALECCATLFVNKQEAYRLTGVSPKRGEQDEHQMSTILRGAGCARVFITDGARGAEAFEGEQHYQMPAYKARVASTVGAGDAFAAGAITALVRGESVEMAMKIGSLNAASVVQSLGATEGLVSWEEARRLVEECPPGHRCPLKQQARERQGGGKA